MELNAENVKTLFRECLSDEENGTATYGIMANVYMNTEGKEDDIKSLLDQLPDAFKVGHGGGMSFLNMCVTKDDVQWTGMHQIMEELVLMGIASDQASFTLPKEMWAVLPGQMPYITVKS